VAASRKIIEALLDDLAVAVNDTTVIYERYRVNPVEMESRNDIPRGRIALYEQSELVTTKVDAEKPKLVSAEIWARYIYITGVLLR